MRILYVEDNPANLFLVQRVARMGSHEVMNYTTGEAALENFERDHPDLVLMDVQLAGNMTGLDVVRKLRGSGYQTPIIAVTAYAMIGDRERCLDAGCDDYLAKPLPVPKLVEIIKRYDPLQQGEEANPATLPSRPTQELPPPDKMPYIKKPDYLTPPETAVIIPPAPTAPASPPATPVAPSTPVVPSTPAPAVSTSMPAAVIDESKTREVPALPTTPAVLSTPVAPSTPAVEPKSDDITRASKAAETQAPETPTKPAEASVTAPAVPAVPSTPVAPSTPVVPSTPAPAESKAVEPEADADPDAKTEPFRPAGLGLKKEDKA
jgi:two-component system cell cycle response regulator DivK